MALPSAHLVFFSFLLMFKREQTAATMTYFLAIFVLVCLRIVLPVLCFYIDPCLC